MTSPARSTSMDPGLEAPSRRSPKAKDVATLDMFGTSSPALVTHVVEVRAHLRTVPGAKPASGAERRDAALDDMAGREPVQIALAYAREKLVALFKSRQSWMTGDKHWVNADDADKIWRQWAQFPVELRDANANWKGSTFNAKGWKRIPGRTTPSLRDRMNRTDLALWRWEGE